MLKSQGTETEQKDEEVYEYKYGNTTKDYNVNDDDNGAAFAFLEACFGVRFQNLLDGATITGPTHAKLLEIGPDAIEGSWLIQGDFRAIVDLRSYPFDICGYDAILSIIGWSPGIIMAHSSLCSFTDFECIGLSGSSQANTQDRWNPHFCEQGVVPNAARRAEAMAYVRFHGRRNPMPAILNLFFPLCLITSLGVIGMYQASRSSDFGGLDFQVSSLMTIVLLRASGRELLPPGLGYNTMFDWYLFACIGLLCASILVLGFATFEDLDSWKISLPVGYALLFLVGNVVFVVAAFKEWYIPLERESRARPLFKNPNELENSEPRDSKYMHPGPGQFRCEAKGNSLVLKPVANQKSNRNSLVPEQSTMGNNDAFATEF